MRKLHSRLYWATLRYLLIAFLLVSVTGVWAQVVRANTPPPRGYQEPWNQKRVSLKVKNERLVTVLEKIEKQVSHSFVYSNDDINAGQRVSIQVKDMSLAEVLDLLTKQVDARYEILNDKIILRNRTGKPTGNTQITFSAETAKSFSGLQNPAAILINGVVINDKGLPVEGVSVTLKGGTTGTVTDAQGRYTLSVPDDAATSGILVFSSIGYSDIEERINNRRQINISILPVEKTLDDVVVVGYGTQRRASMTGAVDKVGRDMIEGRPVANLTQALQGASPNLIIQQRNFEPGQGVNLNIRGLGTLGDNTPLVVIDGIIGGDINLLNPNDIESVTVLKDAGSAAIYGSRAANGVLPITTRKGKKNEKARVAYSGIYGVQTPRVTYEPVHAWENAYYKNESLANSGLQPLFTPEQIQQFADAGDGDWRLKNILQDAAQQNHSLTVSGGSATNTYLLSVGYLDQGNNFIGPDYGYKRYNLRMNQTTELGKFRLTSVLSYAKSMGKDHSSSSSSLIVDAGRVPLYYSFQDADGNYLTNPVSSQYNPKAILEKGGYRKSNDDEIFGSFNGEYSITKDLKIRGVFGGTVRSNNMTGRRLQVDFVPGSQYGQDREVRDENYKALLTNTQLIAEYGKIIGDHNFKVMAGVTNESFKSEQFTLVKTLTDPNLGVPTTGTIVDPNSLSNLQRTTETSIHSALGRLNYSYADRYFVEFNFRYDGSSNFAKDNRWGFFPSVAASWKMTDEAFFSFVKERFGDVKLRGSYGILGNQNVRPYQYQTSFFNYQNAYGFNNVVVGGAGFALGNPELTWEKAATFNIGVDASLFNKRLDISYDYFDKMTSDILVPRRDVPLLFGAGFPDFNTAEVRNRGWEVRATYTLPGRKFTHTFSANVADNLNELRSFTFGANQLVERREEFEFARRIGQPITVYQGYRVAGYFQNLHDLQTAPIFVGQNRNALSPGDLMFVDRNKDGVIDDNDKFVLGNPFPRYTFGFTYTARFKGFDLLLFAQGVGKRDAMIRGELVEPFHFGYGGTMYRHQTDYWTPTNPGAKYPRLAEAGSASNSNNWRTGSDLYLHDAAYVRLKNVQIGYSIPDAVMQKLRMQRARVYFTGQNLLTLTKLDFLDPEISEFNNNLNFDAGANSARAYPLPVFFGFGLDITF